MTRAMLLPMSAALARKASLQNHMAPVALRQGRGNVDLARTLLATVYWTYFASDADTLERSWETLVAAERAVKESVENVELTDDWKLDAAHCQSIEAILRLHDAQLESLPLHLMERSRLRLYRALESLGLPTN